MLHNHILKHLLLACLYLTSLTVFTIHVLAQESEIKYTVLYQQVNPGDGSSYLLKRLKENITLAILSPFPARKADYYKELINVRLAELKYIVDNKDPDKIETSSQRYYTMVGRLTEMLTSNSSLKVKKDEIKNLLEQHVKIVEDLKPAYNDTTAEWRFLKHDADYLKIYISNLSN